MDETRVFQKAVKQKLLDLFEESKGIKGSKLNSELIAEFLTLSPRTIYRLRELDDYLLPVQICPSILNLVDSVREARAWSRSLVEGWAESAFGKLPKSAGRVLAFMFKEKYAAIFKDTKLTADEKIESLAFQFLGDWVEQIKKSRED
jgi:hypothetical protein